MSAPVLSSKEVCCGWLFKQGNDILKGWKRRWFAIRGCQMLLPRSINYPRFKQAIHTPVYLRYFKEPGDDKPLGVISLYRLAVEDDGSSSRRAPAVVVEHLSEGPDVKRKHAFVIRGENAPGGRQYLLCADSVEEMKKWIATCIRVIYSPLGGGVFGCDLEEQVLKEGEAPDAIPAIVRKCTDFLSSTDEQGFLRLKESGIFRLPGRSTRINELQLQFDMGRYPNLMDEPEVHAVGSLLKLYLRQLPDPLLTSERFEAFLGAARLYEEAPSEGILVLQKLIRDLPCSNAHLLQHICNFLSEVSMHSDDNKMTPNNLAVVFAPGFLLPPNDASPDVLMQSNSLVQLVTRVLIERNKLAFALITPATEAEWAPFRAKQAAKEAAAAAAKALAETPDFDMDDEDLSTRIPVPPLPDQAQLTRLQAAIQQLSPVTSRRSVPGMVFSPGVAAPEGQYVNKSCLYSPATSSYAPRSSFDTTGGDAALRKLMAELMSERDARHKLEEQLEYLTMENRALKEQLKAAAGPATPSKETRPPRPQAVPTPARTPSGKPSLGHMAMTESPTTNPYMGVGSPSTNPFRQMPSNMTGN